MVELKLLRRGRRPVLLPPSTTSSPHAPSNPLNSSSSIPAGQKSSSSLELHVRSTTGAVAATASAAERTINQPFRHLASSFEFGTTDNEPSLEIKLIHRHLSIINQHLPSHTSKPSTRYSAITTSKLREATKGLETASMTNRGLLNVLNCLVPELERPGGGNRSGNDNTRAAASSAASTSALSSLDVLRSHRELLRITARCLIRHWSHHLRTSSSTLTSKELILIDPLPIEEAFARRLLTVSSPVRTPRSSSLSSTTLSATPSSISTLVRNTLQNLFENAYADLGQLLDRPFSTLSSSSIDAREELRIDITHYSSILIYFLSASNWNVVNQVFKLRIAGHGVGASTNSTTVTKIATAEGEIDASDLRIVETCCLNRARLIMIFQDSFSSFLHLNKSAQLVLAQCLRSSIWSFISSFPHEFNELVSSNRRIEGGCDMLFDLLWAQGTELSSDNVRRMKTIPTTLWSSMMMLLICCPDIVEKLSMTTTSFERGSINIDGESLGKPAAFSKKAQFLTGLKNSLIIASSNHSNLNSSTGSVGLNSNDSVWDSFVDLLLVGFTRLDHNGSTSTKTTTTNSIHSLAHEFARDFISNFPKILEPTLTQYFGPSRTVTTRCLVAIAKLDQVVDPSSISTLFDRLLQTKANLTWQLSAVNALIILSTNFDSKSSFKWSSGLPNSLKLLFDHAVNSPRGRKSRSQSVTTAGMTIAIEEDGSIDLIRAILLLWTESPRFLVSNSSLVEGSGVEHVPVAIGKAARDALEESIDRLGFKTILSFFESKDPIVEKAREAKGVDWSSLGKIVAHRVLEADDGTNSHLLLIKILVEISKRWQLTKVENVSAGWNAFEASIIVSLVSPSNEIKELAMECARFMMATSGKSMVKSPLRALFTTATIPKTISGPSNETIELFKSSVRYSEEPSMGLLIAWDEINRRTSDLSVYLFRGRSSTPSGIKPPLTSSLELMHWSSLTSLLLIMSAVCTRKPGPDDVNVDARLTRRHDRLRQSNSLVQELIEHLVTDDALLRQTALNLLGSDLDLRQFGSFVSHLKRLARYLSPNRPSSGTGTPPPKKLLVSQCLAVLQMLLDRVGSQPLPSDVSTPLTDLLVTFAEYIDSIIIDEDRMKLELGFCSLVESVFSRALETPSDGFSRARLVEYLYRWIGTSDEKFGVLRAIAVLFKASPFEDDKGPTDRALFNRYFDQLVTSLVQLGVDVNNATLEEKKRTKEALMNGLAELLISNPELTRKRLSQMTLSESTEVSKRIIYLETIKTLLDRGVKFDAPKKSNENDIFGQIVELVRHKTSLALALCEICPPSDYDDLIETLLRILATPSATATFLRAVIAEEVRSTDHESTLFRGNSFASRLLTVYSKSQGYHYLRDTLKSLLVTLSQRPPEFNLDFDPHRDSPAEDAASRNLIQITEAFLVSISQSIDSVPVSLRELCGHIAEVVGSRFPDSVYTAVGGFIFLRFINPAIVSPETIDLDLPVQTLSSDNREFRRGLVSISKVLQALANNVRFGVKEPGMRALNPFMDRNIMTMTGFLSALSSMPTDPLTTSGNDAKTQDSMKVSVVLSQSNRQFLHRFLVDNCSKIGSELLGSSKASDMASASELWEHLTGLIAALGPRQNAFKSLLNESNDRTSFEDFMARNAFMATGDEGNRWAKVFYRTSVPLRSQPNSTLFIFSVNQLDSDSLDLGRLAFWVLYSLSTCETEQINLLFDLTAFSDSNAIPPSLFRRWFDLLPDHLVQRIGQTILFSVNFRFRAYLRQLELELSIDSRKIVAVGEVSELEQQYPDITSELPYPTLEIAREPCLSFGQITLKHPVRVQIPVIFYIGSSTLRIVTTKPQAILGDLVCTFVDLIPLSTIEDVSLNPSENDEVLLSIISEDQPRKYLVKSVVDELISRLRIACANAASSFTRSTMENRDSLASIVCLATESLASPIDVLRKSGYRLVRSLGKSYNATGFNELIDAQGLHVPLADISLLTSTSDSLSLALPPRIAFDVLEGLVGIITTSVDMQQSISCIHSLRPWLHNLTVSLQVSRDEVADLQRRLRRVVKQLLKLAADNVALGSTLAARVWPALGRLDSMHGIILDEATRIVAIERNESIDESANWFGDILVALGSGTLLRGRVLSRIRQALMQKAASPLQSELTEIDKKISTLLRFDLSLSFDSKASSQLFLPEIFHVVMSLAGEGTLRQRSVVRLILINTVNGLARERDCNRERLSALVNALASDAVLELIGLDQRPPQQQTKVIESLGWDPLKSGDRLAQALGEVLEAAAPNTDTENAWRTRWAALASSLCFQYDIALQMRSITTLSYLGASAMDDDVVYQILTTLSHAVRSKNGSTLAALLTRCLARVIQTDSKFLLATTDTAIALLLLRSPVISTFAVSLLAVSIEKLQASGAFEEERALNILAELRRLDTATSQVEPRSSVSLNVDFAFGIGSLLLHQLRQPRTASDAIYCLLSLIHHSTVSFTNTTSGANGSIGKTSPSWLGAFIALLPILVSQGRLVELQLAARIKVAEPSQTAVLQQVIQALRIDDRASALLSLALSIQLLEDVNSEEAAAALFFVISRALTPFPDLVELVSDSLARIVNHHLSRSVTNRVLSQALDELALSMSSSHVPVNETSLPGQPSSSDIRFLEELNQLGFDALAPTHLKGRYSISILRDDDWSTTNEEIDVETAELVSAIISNSLSL